MKECRVSLMGGRIDCSKMSGGRCALMDNEGVPEGKLNAMWQTFRGMSTETLQRLTHTHSSGGFRANDCLASPQIDRVATAVLNERRQEE